MAKKLTVNEMIYNTLTTKITKEPKYKEVLEALGYELNKDHDWSAYDYWGIKMAERNLILLISKGRDNKRHLYKTATFVHTKDIAKVDFENLIKTDRSDTRPRMFRPDTRIEAYKRAKDDYKIHLSICEGAKTDIVVKEEALEKAKESLKRWEGRTAESKTKLDKIIAEIRG